MADEHKGEGEPKKEPTVSEIIEETVPKQDETPEETVPLATFLSTKKDAKKFEKLYNELKDKKDSGESSADEISDDLEALATEFDIEPKFVNKLAKLLEGRATKKVGETMKPILEKAEELSKKDRDAAIDKAFTKHYADALETMPEYKDIANADAIKALSLLPQNSKKTFAQLIEETYGKAIVGRETIDDTKVGGGKDPEPIDFDRAKQDTEYFQEIMKDPARKAEYNAHMLAPKNRKK